MYVLPSSVVSCLSIQLRETNAGGYATLALRPEHCSNGNRKTGTYLIFSMFLCRNRFIALETKKHRALAVL